MGSKKKPSDLPDDYDAPPGDDPPDDDPGYSDSFNDLEEPQEEANYHDSDPVSLSGPYRDPPPATDTEKGIFGKSQSELIDDSVKLHLETLADEVDNDAGYIANSDVLDDFESIEKFRPGDWERIEEILRKKKKLQSAKKLLKNHKKVVHNLRIAGPGDEEATSYYKHHVKDAPISDKAKIPHGWEIGKGSHNLIKLVIRTDKDGMNWPNRTNVCHTHIIVSEVLTDLESGESFIKVSAKLKGKWVSTIIPRKQLASPVALAETLAAKGMPVNVNNAKDVILWLEDWQAANKSHIPETGLTHQMGHVKGAFMYGRECIGGNYIFNGADTGDEQMADRISKRGSFEGWREAITGLDEFPRVEVALYIALASPLLELLEVESFGAEWAEKTSCGKTTTLKVAASLFGNPNPRANNGYVLSWDGTAISIERRAAVLQSLPVILDDTKMAGENQLGKQIYGLFSGSGRGRATAKGLQAARNWQVVFMFTGESRSLDDNKSGGTAARLMEFWCYPFGTVDSKRVSKFIEKLSTGIKENYGHAGKLWIEHIISKREEMPRWREFINETKNKYIKIITCLDDKPNDLSVVDRVAEYLAVIDFVGRESTEVLNLPWEYNNPVESVISLIAESAKTADREQEALEDIASWLSARTHLLRNHENANEGSPPSQGWVGWVNKSDTTTAIYKIGVYAGVIKEQLSKLGYEPLSILRRWSQEGIVVGDGKNITASRIDTDGKSKRMVMFALSKLEKSGFVLYEDG